MTEKNEFLLTSSEAADSPIRPRGRRLACAAFFIGVSAVAGGLGVWGQKAGFYGTQFGAAMFCGLLVLVFTGLSWWAAVTAATRRKLDEALRQREVHATSILNSITDGFHVLDAAGRFKEFNTAARAMFAAQGLDAAALIGQHFFDEAFPQVREIPVGRAIQRTLAERVPTEAENLYEPWQRWYFVRNYPTPEGGVATFFQDITERKRTEEQLRRSAELVKVLIDRSPTGFYIVDADFRISHLNADSQARAFRNVNPAIGRRFDDAIRIIWPEPLATEIIGIFRHTLETGEPYKSPGLDSPRADLERVETYEWQVERITMPEGRHAVVCYYYDTTPLREAELAVRRSRERFDIVRDAAQVGFWFCDLPFDKLVWDNRVKEHFWLAPDAPVTIDTFYERIHPDDRERTRAAIAASIANHTRYDIAYRTVSAADGREKWIRAIGRTFYDADDQPIRFDGVTLDITENKRAEAALRENEAVLRSVASEAHAGLVMVNEERRYLFANQTYAEILGLPDADIVGQRVAEVLPTVYEEQIKPRLDRALAGERVGYELRLPAAGGTGRERFYEVIYEPRTNVNGRYVVVVIMDITERKKAQEILERTVAERTARLTETIGDLEGFSYSITHDLRAPLRAVNSFSHMLAEEHGAQLDDAGKRLLARIQQSVTRMDKLIQDVLQYSRVLRMDLKLEAVNADRLVRGMLDSYPDLQEPKATIRIEGQLPAVCANEAALTQCFSNMLNNAVKFVPAGVKPQVTVRAVQGTATVRFWIEDNGIGIEPKYLGNLFGLFQRLTNEYAGTGVGLSIVRKAVERMGGAVGVESELGKGSRFWFELKAAESKGKPA